MGKQTIKHITIMVPHGLLYAWDVANGVRAYVNRQPDLRLSSKELTKTDWLKRLDTPFPDGLIGFFSQSHLSDLAKLDIPSVNFATLIDDASPHVIPDHHAIGSLAADHLVEVGCFDFLFLSFQSIGFAEQRYQGFADRLKEKGYPCERFIWLPDRVEELKNKLRTSSHPLGVCSADDGCGVRLAELADQIGLTIPGHLTIVSVNNDERMCELAPVSLSSIAINGEMIGYTAARMIHDLIRGKPVASATIPPLGVDQRDSTQPSAINDPDLDFTLQQIQQRACKGLKISEIAAQIAISRRTLEMRFRNRFGRSLHDEICRVRFARAQELLLKTDITIGEIAGLCGFAKHSVFTDQFGRTFGMTPTAYRRSRSASPLIAPADET